MTGFCYARLKQPEKARESFRKVLQSDAEKAKKLIEPSDQEPQ